MIFNHANYAAEEELRADVVVVGTGAGGATVGKELAEAGRDVLFMEEGGYHPTSSFSPYMTESIPRLYRDAAATVIFGNPPIAYIEGRCVGGSTVINGGMVWRTPEAILHRWKALTGEPDLGPEGLSPFFEEMELAIHAKKQHPVSKGGDNDIMARGPAKMGWEYETNRRNQDTCVGTNNCVFGCPTGAKQSTLVSMMPKALAAGARCATEVRVERLWIERGRCVGVHGRAIHPITRARDKRVSVRADTVIIACGSIQSAHLLLRHRVARRSGNLGKNFLCHPNAKVLGVYPHEVNAWQGVSQFGQTKEFTDQGILLAANMVPPGPLASSLPLHGAKSWELMRNYNNMVLSGVLVEDSRPGRVKRGPWDMAVAKYDITTYDHARFLKGIRHLAEMHFAMGADRVVLPFVNLSEINSPDDLTKIEKTQTRPSTLELFTVHLMGTARMGGSPRESVVNTEGEIWDLPGCYVVDASIFPTAIGVNPQLTIMAMATRIARRLAERTRAKRQAA